MEIEYIQNVDVVEENGESDSVGQEWIDVLGEYDFSGKKIIGVQIGDKKIKTRNATDAYCVVHKFLLTYMTKVPIEIFPLGKWRIIY